jgi:hypothetical protein
LASVTVKEMETVKATVTLALLGREFEQCFLDQAVLDTSREQSRREPVRVLRA